MTDRELMQMALDALEEAADHVYCPGDDDAIGVARKALRARLAQPEQREVEIEFKEWIDPHIGVLQINPKTPLILKAVIRERDAPALQRMNKAAEDNGEPL